MGRIVTPSEAGIGGRACLAIHGRGFYSIIGKLGGRPTRAELRERQNNRRNNHRKPEVVKRGRLNKGGYALSPNAGPSLCIHYWIIEECNGPQSKGVCRKCGTAQIFNNHFDFSNFPLGEKYPVWAPIVLEGSRPYGNKAGIKRTG